MLTRRPILLVVCVLAFAASAEERTGEAVYKQDCLKCHGAAGEGSKKAQPLTGEKSPAQLANVIARIMPEDDPGRLKDNENKKVAAYIYETFYSPDAQARLNPPHVELSRLTVGQYRNAVADLIGSFGKAAKADERHGLHGEYLDGRGFDGARFGGRKALLDRIDTEVKFDWGTSAPDGTPAPPPPPPAPPKAKDAKPEQKDAKPEQKDAKPIAPAPAPEVKKDADAKKDEKPEAKKDTAPEPKKEAPDDKKKDASGSVPAAQNEPKPEPKKFNPKQFCVSWEGSIFAPETGTYEFIVRSEHGVQLWVNDLNNRRPLIDAAVRSGADQPLRAPILLLGGRTYSLRLEFCKGKELDKKKMDDPRTVSKKASVALLWKRPHGSDEIIPASFLSPSRSPEILIVNTPFPPDDRSYGWERGTSVSKEWNAATTDAALEVAGFVAARLGGISGVPGDAQDRTAKLKEFAKTFVERAFRRPLSDAEKKTFIEHQFVAASDVDLAMKRVVLLALKSPRFLYPEILEGENVAPASVAPASSGHEYAVASRLSFALLDSSPDAALMEAAAAGKLSTKEELAAQAERLLNTPRARTKLREFLLTWLRVDRFPELMKDAKRFPGFDAAVVGDLRTSLELFLDDVVWSKDSDFRQLLLSDEMYLNGRLAKLYGADLPADSGFVRKKWESGKRSGVLTHPYMLAGLAYPGESSPIHRGVFVVRGLLGLTLKPPPDAVTPIPPDLHPNLTTRERVAMQTKPGACIQCHALINPLGFALENFDAIGRYRAEENSKPIDVSGEYETRSGEVVKFAGARQLAGVLAKEEQVQAAFTQQLFQHLTKQAVRAYGLDMPKKLQEMFTKSNYSVRRLVVEIAVIAAQENESRARQ